MAKPPKWKMDKLERRESVSIIEARERIKDARQRAAMIVHGAARERGLIVSGRNREALYKRIADVYLQLDNGLKDWDKDMIRKGAIDWHDAAIRDITGQTGIDPSNGVTRFSREYAEDVFKRVHPENGKSLAGVLTEKMADNDVKALRQAVTDVYREGSLSGMTMSDMANTIKERWDGLAGNMAANKFVDAAGRTWEDGRYLQMLVRTTTARVSRDSYFNTLTQNGDDLAVIQNADGDACDICTAWDGVIISITGSDERYPSYNNALDAGWGHPNCRCMAERVDETINKENIQQQGDAETPDFTRQPGEADSQYRNRMTEQVAAYSRDFSGESTPIDRQKIEDKKAAEAVKAIPPDLKASMDMTKDVRDTMILDGFTTKVADAIRDIPDETWAIINKSGGKFSVEKAHTVNSQGRIGACYHPYKRTIELKMDPDEWSGHKTTLHHEIGHDAHYQTRAITDFEVNPDLKEAMKQDIKSFLKEQRDELGPDGFTKRYSPSMSYFGGKEWAKEKGIIADATGEHRISSFMDTVGGLTKGNHGAGHSKHYYKSGNNGSMEAYANTFRGIVNKWPEYDAHFPLTTAWIRSSLKL